MGYPVKLNVGCGEFYAEGWTNVDLASDELRRPDIECSVFDLPPEVRDVDRVYLGHVMEHWHEHTIVPALQAIMQRCVPGAEFVVVGPDVPIAVRLHELGQLDEQIVVNCRIGERRWPGDDHLWECSGDRVARYMKEAGLTDVHQVDMGSTDLHSYPVVSRAMWQCAVIGRVS